MVLAAASIGYLRQAENAKVVLAVALRHLELDQADRGARRRGEVD